MPALKGGDIPPGQWHRRRGGRISQQLCPVCRTQLHDELVAHGILTHPNCDPREDRLHGMS